MSQLIENYRPALQYKGVVQVVEDNVNRLRLVGRSLTFQCLREKSTSAIVVVDARAEETGDAFFIKLATTSLGAEQLKREAWILEQLSRPGHPNLVSVDERGDLDGLPWVAMKSRGDHVDCLKRAGHVDENDRLRRVLRVIRGIADALRHLHERGWIHADVSLDNIVVRGHTGTLLDLGEARAEEDSRSLGPLAGISPGSGTLGFVAPERLNGELWDLRADVYSLGCVFYQLVSGRPLYESSAPGGVRRQHMQHGQRKAPESLVDMDPELGGLLSAMICKQPSERLFDLGDLVAAIDRFFGHVTPKPRSPLLLGTRLSGRGRQWDAIDTALRAAQQGGNATLVFGGTEGVGFTRLLSEAVRRAVELQMRVINLLADESERRKSPCEPCLGVADGLTLEELARLALPETARGRVHLASLTDREFSSEYTRERVQELGGALLRLPPLSRQASRRVVLDLFGGRIEGGTVEKLARDARGRPKALIQLAFQRARDAQMVLGNNGLWTTKGASEGALGFEDAGLAKLDRSLLLGLRRAASAARRQDPGSALDKMEIAYQTLRFATGTGFSRRTALRVGFQLLQNRVRVADHLSVRRVSRELLELSGGAHPLMEARILRRFALSERVTGNHREASRLLDWAIERLDACSSSKLHVVERERIRNRLDASWTRYADHDADGALAAARSVVDLVERVGTPEQRAATHLSLANAIVLRSRFSYSPSAVRHERYALRIHHKAGGKGTGRTAARFELGFMLLLGGLKQCREAVQTLELAAEETDEVEDGILAARVATYLCIGYRRVGRRQECDRLASWVLDRARECGQSGYMGVAYACRGWAAMHGGALHEAESELGTALRIWQRTRSREPCRRSEYPFQWLSLVPLIGLALGKGNGTACLDWCRDLVHPTQAILAFPLNHALEEAVHRGSSWDETHWQAWGDRFVRLAVAHQYL